MNNNDSVTLQLIFPKTYNTTMKGDYIRLIWLISYSETSTTIMQSKLDFTGQAYKHSYQISEDVMRDLYWGH